MKKGLIFSAFIFLVALVNLNFVFADSLSCCLEGSGYCSSNKESSDCVSGGGSVLGSGACYDASRESSYDQCKLAGCIFTNERCSLIPKSRCENVLNGRVDTGITSQQQCDDVNYNVNLGCCLSDCRMKLRSQCSGTFDSGSCDAVDECSVSGLMEICSNDGKAKLKVDNQNRLVGFPELCPEDSRCVMDGNNPICKKTSCEIGKETIVSVIDIGLSTSFVEKIDINADMLGFTDYDTDNGRTFRKNGESWCIVYGTKEGNNWEIMPKGMLGGESEDLGRKFSAGQRHSAYSCNDGNIVVESGDIFRGKKGICFENNELAYYLAGDDKKWGMCDPKDDKDENKRNEALERLDNEVFFVDGHSSNPRVIAYRNSQKDLPFSQAKLVDNFDLEKDCKPIYNVGSRFYPPPYSQTGIASELQCGKCGDGTFDLDRCGENECYRLGDCRFKGAGVVQRVKDCGKGVVIAWSTYRLGKSLIGSGAPSAPAGSNPSVPTGPPATSPPSVPFVPPEEGIQSAASTVIQQGAQRGAQQGLNNWQKLNIAANSANAVRGTFELARYIRSGNSPSYADDSAVGTINPGENVNLDRTSTGADGSVRGHPTGFDDNAYIVLATNENDGNQLRVED